MASCYRLYEQLTDAAGKVDTGKKSARNRKIACKYYGLDGRGGLSMEKIGEQFDLTRESVRQVNNRFSKELSLLADEIPSLSEACQLLSDHVPIYEKDLRRLFEENGLAPFKFRAEGIIRLIEIMGCSDRCFEIVQERKATFIVERLPSEQSKQESQQYYMIKEIMAKAIKRVSSNGAVNIDELMQDQDIIDVTGPFLSRRLVRSAVEAMPSAKWIEENDWAFFGEKGRNKILIRVDKMFSIVREADLDDVYQGLKNSLATLAEEKKNLEILPRHLLVKMLELTGRYRVINGDTVVCEKPKKAKALLRKFELDMANLLRNAPSFSLREKQLEDHLVKKGSEDADKDKYNFSMALNHSPLFIRRERGLYSLIGRPWP